MIIIVYHHDYYYYYYHYYYRSVAPVPSMGNEEPHAWYESTHVATVESHPPEYDAERDDAREQADHAADHAERDAADDAKQADNAERRDAPMAVNMTPQGLQYTGGDFVVKSI